MKEINLTEDQKELLRHLVRAIREKRLDQPIDLIGNATVVPALNEDIHYNPGDFDALCDSGLMSWYWSSTGKRKLYNITQAGYNAVDNDFKVSSDQIGAQVTQLSGDGAIAGERSVAAGAQGVAVGGDVHGPLIVAGETRGPIFDEEKLYLSGPEFEEYAIDLLQGGNTILLQRYLQSAAPLLFRLVNGIQDADDDGIRLTQEKHLVPILDSLAVFGTVFVRFGQQSMFDQLRRALYGICRRASKTEFAQPQDQSLHFSPSWIWREVITRVYALGAMLVADRKYDWTPILIRQPVDWERRYRSVFWARYFLIVLARENRLKERSLCRAAVAYIENNDFLAGQFLGDSDEWISAVCQFDFLQCVHLIAETNSITDAYPSFGVYYHYRTEPIITDLVSGGPVRESIPEVSDQTLANIIRGLDQLAADEYILHSGWEPHDWSDKAIAQFLAQHAPSSGNTTG